MSFRTCNEPASFANTINAAKYAKIPLSVKSGGDAIMVTGGNLEGQRPPALQNTAQDQVRQNAQQAEEAAANRRAERRQEVVEARQVDQTAVARPSFDRYDRVEITAEAREAAAERQPEPRRAEREPTPAQERREPQPAPTETERAQVEAENRAVQEQAARERAAQEQQAEPTNPANSATYEFIA